MVMEDVDLGKDRTQLIDFIYGKREGSESISPSIDKSIPLTEDSRQQPKPRKPSKRVSCSSTLCILLFLISLLAIIGAAYLGHLITKQEYEMMGNQTSAAEPIVCKNYSRPLKKTHRPIIHDEDADENDAVTQPTKEELALPKSITPVWYKVSLSPSSGSDSTNGIAVVKLNVTEDTNKIVINANGLKFSDNLEKIRISNEAVPAKRTNRVKRSEEEEEASGMAASEEEAAPSLVDTGLKVTNIQFLEGVEKVVLTLDAPLKKGSEVVLKMPFAIEKKETSDNGLKEYTYNIGGGANRSIFTTQLNYAYMRHVFPSFDQESFKAPASLTLMHSKGSVVVANTPSSTVEDGDSLVTTLKSTFDPDFVIGDLVLAKQANASSGVQINIWTRPEVKNDAELVLQYSVDTLDDLEHILQSRLETKKLDIIAVPGFQSGNRVSPAFIILPEEDIILPSATDDVIRKVRLARLLSNRIAAQWFGGITNPEEYGTFWLNDALPKYLEVEALEKSLNLESDDLWTLDLESILEQDAMVTSRPLKMKHHYTKDMEETRWQFMAEKGAALLRMIEKAIGKEAFNKGIRNFVSSYRSSYPYDDGLWKSFQKSVNDRIVGWNGETLDVAKFVNTWVDQSGFPLVSLGKLDDENVEISQERFKNDDETMEDLELHNAKYWFNWEVPLFVSSDADPKNVSWLHEAFRLPLNKSENIYLNTDSNGIYRVDYREKRWNRISQQLEADHTKFSPRTRARLISDAFALADTGRIPYETALNLTSYLPKETEVIPWLVAADKFQKIVEKLEGSDFQPKLNKLIFDRISNEFDKITSDDKQNEEYFESILKFKLLNLASLIKPQKSNEKLGELFKNNFLANCQPANYSSQCSKVPGELRSQVYCNGVEFGDDSVLELIQNFAEKEIDSQEKSELIQSLGCFRDPRTLRDLISRNLNSTATVTQLLRKMNSRPVGREIATNFIIDNWSLLKKKFRDQPDVLNEIVDAAVLVNNERVKSTLENFINHHRKSTHSIGSLEKKLESGTSDIFWRRQKDQDLRNYLDGKMKGPSDDEEDDSSEEQ